MTSIRKGNCKLMEFDAEFLSELLQEMGKFISVLENREHARYLKIHVEEAVDNLSETEWWKGTVWYDYFLEKWEDFDPDEEAAALDFEQETMQLLEEPPF
jgi:hypothetical protein